MIDYVFPNYLLGMMFIAGYANYPIYVLILPSKLKESCWHAVFCWSEVRSGYMEGFTLSAETRIHTNNICNSFFRCCYSSMFVC